jgi:hypothetical protein
MKKHYLFFAVFGLLFAPFAAHSVNFPLSKYGQIQNVQSYSSNPFYNQNSPYNLRMPVPIYAQGTELNAGECRSVADSLVARECGARNNCSGLSFSDIRPAVIIQMSNLGGHNYVSSCSGYIQPAFDDYVNGANIASGGGFPSAFPMGGGAAQPSSTLEISNPFEREDPQWQKNRDARQAELRALQRQNGSDDVALSATQFPTTYADLSFTERMDNERAGYQPWKDTQAYKPMKIENDAEKRAREKEEFEHRKNMAEEEKKLLQLTDFDGWCRKYPSDCQKNLSEQLAGLNSGLKESACAGKIYGTDITYKEWAVVKNSDGVWELKADAKTITLNDAACNKQDPNAWRNDDGKKEVVEEDEKLNALIKALRESRKDPYEFDMPKSSAPFLFQVDKQGENSSSIDLEVAPFRRVIASENSEDSQSN